MWSKSATHLRSCCVHSHPARWVDKIPTAPGNPLRSGLASRAIAIDCRDGCRLGALENHSMAKAKTGLAPATGGNVSTPPAPTAPRPAVRVQSQSLRDGKPSTAAASRQLLAKPIHLPSSVFKELEIVRDPSNLFHQTIEQVL